MKDYIVRAVTADKQIRIFASRTTNMVEEAKNIHGLSPVAATALGRLLTGGAMMGAMLKNDDDVLTIQIECQGPIKGLVVTSDSKGNVKGYVNVPDVDLPLNGKGQLDVAGALGLGVMSVIKDIGLKEPYVGQTILVTSEIGDDLTYYFSESEQTPSSVGVGVLLDHDNTVKCAGGFILQLMPNTSEETIEKLEERIKTITSVTGLIENSDSPESLIENIVGDMGYEIMDVVDTGFNCNCSRERVEKALISLGSAELKNMIADGKEEELKCHFCNKSYKFTTEDLRSIVSKAIVSRMNVIGDDN